MTLFGAVRVFSALELALFAALLVVWLGHVDETAKFVLGLSHGIGVILLCLLIYIGCLKRVFPWPLLAAAVLLGPVGSTVGIEMQKRRGAGSRAVA
jgi:hypothetical protein